MTGNILIAEDENAIAGFVEKGLRTAGFVTSRASDGETALLLARTGAFDLVVLDVGMPRLDGFEVLRRLRHEGIKVPVIMLTARSGVDDTLAGLEGGAQDYMTKPFEVAELIARIKLRIRGSAQLTDGATIEAAGMTLDLRSRRVHFDDDAEPVDLTDRECALLRVFLEHPDQVLSRAQLLDRVWGEHGDSTSNVVDVFIRTLRRKIGPDQILTVRGLGYRLPRRS